MKTWRERIAEARARGRFTKEDYAAIMDIRTCMVAEASAPLGEHAYQRFPILAINAMAGNTWWPNGIGPLWCVSENLFDLAEDRLTQIEDQVLQLKREAMA